MSTTETILPYATTTQIPTSGHARLSLWSGVLSFPIIYLLALAGGLTRVEYLPPNKAGVLLLCFQTFMLYSGPLSALTYGISAVIRIGFGNSQRHGIAFAWAGIALGATIFLALLIL